MTRIAFADARDDRVVGAAATLASTGRVRPVLIDPDPAVHLPAGVEGIALEGDVDPLTFLAEYVRAGHADAGIAGSLSSSTSVIRAGIGGLALTDW